MKLHRKTGDLCFKVHAGRGVLWLAGGLKVWFSPGAVSYGRLGHQQKRKQDAHCLLLAHVRGIDGLS